MPSDQLELASCQTKVAVEPWASLQGRHFHLAACLKTQRQRCFESHDYVDVQILQVHLATRWQTQEAQVYSWTFRSLASLSKETIKSFGAQSSSCPTHCTWLGWAFHYGLCHCGGKVWVPLWAATTWLGTLNLQRAGVVKNNAVATLLREFECSILGIQELDLNAASNVSYVEDWRKLGFTCPTRRAVLMRWKVCTELLFSRVCLFCKYSWMGSLPRQDFVRVSLISIWAMGCVIS